MLYDEEKRWPRDFNNPLAKRQGGKCHKHIRSRASPQASIGISASAEQVGSRTPGMMRDLVKPSGSVDPHKGIRRSQFPLRNGGEGRGAVVALQGAKLA